MWIESILGLKSRVSQLAEKMERYDAARAPCVGHKGKEVGKEALFCKFLNFSTLTVTGINSHSNSYNIKDSPPNLYHLGRLWKYKMLFHFM